MWTDIGEGVTVLYILVWPCGCTTIHNTRQREEGRERERDERVSSIGKKPHVRVCHPATTKTMSTSHANIIQMG